MGRSIAATLIALSVGNWSGPIRADDPAARDPKAESARAAVALELTRAQAGLYRLELAGPNPRPVALRPGSLLQWSNPVAGSIHGAVFAWTDRGCPVAVASIYKWFEPQTHLGIELHALTPALRSADRRGRRAWTPRGVEAERRPIAGAPAPADSPTGRLRQLRALAGEHSATETTREDIFRPLRLLTQPIYRYESTDPDVLDGGIFAFVEGTDPEILLLIEARRAEAGFRWEFAAARMNSLTLKLNHQGREVWAAPTITWDQAKDPREPYTLFTFDDPEA